MTAPLRLNPEYNYRIDPSGTSVFLFFNDGHEYKALTHNVVVDIVDQLSQDRHTLQTLSTVLQEKYDPSLVRDVAGQLLLDRFLIHDAPTLNNELITQWSDVDHSPVDLQHALTNTAIHVASFGLERRGSIEHLEGLGVRRSDLVTADFAVAMTSDVLSPELEVFHNMAVSNKTPWILARIVGQNLWFTAFIPEVTPCWYCFSQAIRRNRSGMLWFATEEHQLYRSSQEIPAMRTPSLMGMAFLENLILHRIFYGHNRNIEGILQLIQARTGEDVHSAAYGYSSDCPHCNCFSERNTALVEPLQSRVKQFTDDGGHRTVDPETAFNRYAHLINPYTGFFRNLRRVNTGKNTLIHTFMMQYCRTAPVMDSADLLRTDTGFSYGKGISEWQSKASCLFEAIERYSGQWRPGIPVRLASYNDISDQAIHPATLLQFSERQYSLREGWNKTCPEKFSVFEPFDENKPVEWVEVSALTTGRTAYIPAAYGFYHYKGPNASFAFADSNGCSAGLTREEAILQGLFEVVERDALALSIGQRIPMTPVDLSEITIPYFDDITTYLSSRRRTLELFRVPSVVDIPCYIALSDCLDGQKSTLSGFGCHLDPVIAVSRAVTEIGQTLQGEDRDTRERAEKDPYQSSKRQQAAWIREHALSIAERLTETENKTTHDVLDDIQISVNMLSEQGFDVFVLDQTDPEVGCPVMKVIVPGMYQFWYRIGGKRMKYVSSMFGKEDRRINEEDVEPVWFIV